MLAGKRVIVTGGAGFVGQHLVALLKGKKAKVYVPLIEEYDLRRQDEVDRLFKEHPADVVFHLASISGGVDFLQKKPALIYKDNLLLHTLILDGAFRHGMKKFIAVGSGLIYPKGAKMPLREDEIWNGYPHEATACYGIPARSLLAQSQFYRREHGFNAIYLIPANLYGPGDHFFVDHPHVIPSMIRKFDKEKEVTLFGTGAAKREFLFVKDAARALIIAAESYNGEEPVNLGTGKATPIKELAEKIAKLTNFKGKINWDSSKPEGEKERCFDVSRMHKILKFTPETSLDEGLKEAIAWYRANKR